MRRWGPLAAAWAISVAYLTTNLYTGWVPHDDGSLAQMAERVLDGQLPHRDFDDIYTGGLNYLHGLAFELFGHELSSMRLVLFAFFVAWVPALYAIARRFTAPLGAAVLVLVSVVWSVPNYTASMPSWYNLFLATFALLALIRYLEARQAAYLVVAGLACGLSVVVKVTGVYALVAILLALLLVEQEETPSTESGPRVGAYGAALLSGLAIVVVALVGTIARRFGQGEVLDFILPGTALCAFLAWNEVTRQRGRSGPRFARAGRLLVPVLAGASIPIALYVLPYAVTGSVGDLVRGVLLEPAARLQFASMAAPLPQTIKDALIPTLPAIAVAMLTWRRGAAIVAIGLTLALLPWLVAVDPEVTRQHVVAAVRWAARLFFPAAALVLAARWRAGTQPPELRLGVFALLAMAAWTALIQFPFSAPIYFLYTVPFFFLALVAFERWRVSVWREPLRPVVSLLVAAFLVAFGLSNLNRYSFSDPWSSVLARSKVARAGEIEMSVEDRGVYPRVVALVNRHSAPGDLIYAGPDSPEVYFFSNRQNRTRILFEFLADDTERESALAALFRDPRLTVAVVNTQPGFSPPLNDRLRRLLEQRLPSSAPASRFEVRWAP